MEKKIKYTYRNRKVYNAQKAQVLRGLKKRDFTRRQHEEAKSRYMKSKITFVQRSVLVKKLVKSRL
jgi:ribosomal protein L25 (general stress protein Ctc)